MKITVKQLQRLIKEAIYQGPDVPVTLNTAPDYAVMHDKVDGEYPGRKQAQVKSIELVAKQFRLAKEKKFLGFYDGKLKINFKPTSKFKYLVKDFDVRELLESLGFSKQAISGVDFMFKDTLLNSILIRVNKRFLQDWERLFGNQTKIDL